MKVVTKQSPNQSVRLHGDRAVRLVIVHTPEGSYASAVATCMSKAAQVSYHRLYRRDGSEATQLVPFDRKAWHAGPMNSLSDGLSLEGFARSFDLADPGSRELARGVAERLVARGLPCRWTTDPAKGGFCRHGDLQADRTDPTADLAEWRRFVAMVQLEHRRLTGADGKRLAVLRTWIVKRRAAGWTWDRVKRTANWREYRRRGGR